MSNFKPVLLVDKQGNEYLAESAIEFNNLAVQGYARKNVKSVAGISAPAPSVTESVVPVEEPADDAKPVRNGRASK